MLTDWKIDVAMINSIGDPLHNVMHSMGTDLVTGWNTLCYTRFNSITEYIQPKTYTVEFLFISPTCL